MNLVLDLDDVVFDFVTPFSKFIIEEGKDDEEVKKFTVKQLYELITRNHFYDNVCKFDFMYYYNKFTDQGYFRHLPLLEKEQLIAAFKTIITYKTNITLATARFLNTQVDTKYAIDNLFISLAQPKYPFRQIYYSEFKLMPKRKIVKLVHGDVFVDNCLTYCTEVKEHNPDTYSVLYRPDDYLDDDQEALHKGKIDNIAHSWSDIEKIVIERMF